MYGIYPLIAQIEFSENFAPPTSLAEVFCVMIVTCICVFVKYFCFSELLQNNMGKEKIRNISCFTDTALIAQRESTLN